MRTYLDTSVISYITNRPSRDIVTLAHQQITREWWARRGSSFDLHVSELVVYEAGRGDAEAAIARLNLIHGLPGFGLRRQRVLLQKASFGQRRYPTKPEQTRCILRLPRSMEWTFY